MKKLDIIIDCSKEVSNLLLDLRQILLSVSVVLSILFLPYGMNFYVLMNKAREYIIPNKKRPPIKKAVTIQLPIFNERYVVKRLVKACIKMVDKYGKDLVQILILDDSTDETTRIAKEISSYYKKLGYDIETIHRDDRTGFKAGALQKAMDKSKNGFLAIFDADFVPPEDFLDHVIPYFEDSKLAIVQCRWTHLNRSYNIFTEAISIGYDGHHLVEQTGRTAGGYLLNFNGSAGVLRKKALEEAGGWQSDTLAEDLDASYRMQLKGWKAIYVKDMKCPAEIPPTIPSIKRQQGRWARGSMSAFRKLGPRVLLDKNLTTGQKAEALVHLSYYAVHPLMFFAYVIALTAAILDVRLVNLAQFVEAVTIQEAAVSPTTPSYLFFIPNLERFLIQTWDALISMPHWIVLNITIVFCAISMWVFYSYSLMLQGISIKSKGKALLALAIIGFGISISNTIAVIQGLFSKKSGSFARTPKYRIERKSDTWRDKKYQIKIDKIVFLEVLFGIAGLLAIVKAFINYNLGIIPILMLYSIAYLNISNITRKEAALEAGRVG
jgi:cellulose synthase/poly-beta-1,6-N-acetylglucosamine synthase-like glycosyltransferase